MYVFASAYQFQYGMVFQVLDIMHGTVEVHLIIKIAIGIFCKIIHAAHSNYAIDEVRAL